MLDLKNCPLTLKFAEKVASRSLDSIKSKLKEAEASWGI
jgi:hypothetical protein